MSDKRKNSRAWHRLKISARNMVRQAIILGILKRSKNCQACERPCEKTQGHHEDYFRPLDVKWLCPSCHGKIHKRNRI